MSAAELVATPRNRGEPGRHSMTTRVVIYGLLILFALVYLIPLVVMVMTSLKPLDEVTGGNMFALPQRPTFQPWIKAWGEARIDSRLLMASDGLGAGLLDTFRRVYLPLCLPGLFGGGTFVLLLSLGFFITPALLGGADSMTLSMLISSFVTARLAWSLAAARSLLLLGIVLILLALTMKLLPMEKGMFAK